MFAPVITVAPFPASIETGVNVRLRSVSASTMRGFTMSCMSSAPSVSSGITPP